MDHVAQEVAVQKRKETKARRLVFEILAAVGVGTPDSATLEPAQALTARQASISLPGSAFATKKCGRHFNLQASITLPVVALERVLQKSCRRTILKGGGGNSRYEQLSIGRNFRLNPSCFEKRTRLRSLNGEERM